MSYYLAPALVQLRDQINQAFPKRDKSSDGWIGDTSHSARASDHNPKWSEKGIVLALDIDIDDNDPKRDLRTELIRAAIASKRTYYVISNGIIYSRTYGFRARKYTGANGHYSHVHISLRGGVGDKSTSLAYARRLWADKSRWLISKPTVTEKVVAAVRPKVSLKSLLTVWSTKKASTQVKRVQQALNKKGHKLAVDGLAGPKTRAAYAAYQRSQGWKGKDADGVPGLTSLTRLGASTKVYQAVK